MSGVVVPRSADMELLRAEVTAWAADALDHWLADSGRVPNVPMQFRGKMTHFEVTAHLWCDPGRDPLLSVGVMFRLLDSGDIELSRDGAPWKGFGP